MFESSAPSVSIAFYDGTTLQYQSDGSVGRTITISAAGGIVHGVAANRKAAWVDFLRTVMRTSRTSDPIDPTQVEDLNWDKARYLAAIAGDDWTAFPLPRPLIGIEKLGSRVILEGSEHREICGFVATNLQRIGGDLTLIGGFAHREQFIVFDGFLADHDADTTTRTRLADLRRYLNRIPGIAFAPQVPAVSVALRPKPTVDVYVRRLDDPYTAMPQHHFEHFNAVHRDWEDVATTHAPYRDALFFSPLERPDAS